MENRSTCPICKTPHMSHAAAGANTSEVHCPRCGRYQIQTLAATQLMNSPPSFPPLHLLSGLCRNTWDLLGEKLLITVDLFNSWADLDRAAKLVVPRDIDLVTKGDYLMKYLRRRSKTLADTVTFTPNELAVCFCANRNELLFCLRYLTDKGWIEEDLSGKNKTGKDSSMSYRLTPAGWLALDTPAHLDPPLAVISLLSGTDTEAPWTSGFSAGVTAVGYTAVRLENREHANKITDDLIVDLRRSTCVVADLTGQSPLSFFAGGFAAGLGKPVFWTCEANEARDKRLWLETRQYIVTPWTREQPEVFAHCLAQRIEAGLGRI